MDNAAWRTAYEAAAGTQTQSQLLRMSDQLTRHGVHVVDATPNTLAPALADAWP
ncbi:hypothetical protein [Streptomyces virginiae]|uniref:hypothetical protein n=1 Tax=Streptomyces virginiae TaxID=1961 RepID=UPI00387005C1